MTPSALGLIDRGTETEEKKWGRGRKRQWEEGSKEGGREEDISSFSPFFSSRSLSLGIRHLSVDIESSCTHLVMDEDILRKLREGTEGFTAFKSVSETDKDICTQLVPHHFSFI